MECRRAMDADSLFVGSEYLATVNFILKRRVQFEAIRQTLIVFCIFVCQGIRGLGWHFRNIVIWRRNGTLGSHIQRTE